MNITKKDVNLLWVFQVLYEEQSVSRAAARLNISQPALSHKLNKLRSEFKDDLFVRAARGLSVTPKAREIAPEVQALTQSLNQFYSHLSDDDFLNQEDKVVIYSTDYLESQLLPKLIPQLQAHAPKVQIVTQNTQGQLPRHALASGQADIAIAGFYHDLPESFYQQRVKQESFVVLAHRDLVGPDKTLSLDTYLEHEHIVTTLNGDLHGLVDKALAKQGRSRFVRSGIASFWAPLSVLSDAPVLLTCLNTLADHFIALNPALVKYPCPIELEDVQVMQTWHARTHQDPLRKWLRSQIKACLA